MSYTPFRDGLRVQRHYDVIRDANNWRIDVLHPTADNGKLQCGIDMAEDAFNLSDERALEPALAVLNASIVNWPQYPVTVEQVRERAAEVTA